MNPGETTKEEHTQIKEQLNVLDPIKEIPIVVQTTDGSKQQLLGEKTLGENSNLKSNIFFNSMEKIANKILLIDFLKDSSGYRFYLFLLWMGFAYALNIITAGFKTSQTLFVMYCCNVWFISLAFMFLFIVRKTK
jgi:hypothetical protein